MITVDYEKKYNEALRKIRELIEKGNIHRYQFQMSYFQNQYLLLSSYINIGNNIAVGTK